MTFAPCPECKSLVGCRVVGRCQKPTLPRVAEVVSPPHNPAMQRAVGAALAAQQVPPRKLSADVCFVGGCRKQAETGTGCIGVCRELQREEHEAAAQAAEAGQPLEVARPAPDTAVEAPPGAQTPGRMILLCIDCKSYEKKMTQPKLMGDCINKALPLNLITGERRFPCIIARGYIQLCGTEARLWEKR